MLTHKLLYCVKKGKWSIVISISECSRNKKISGFRGNSKYEF